MKLFLMYLLMSFLSAGGNAVADKIVPLQTVKPAITVSIAVPEERGRRIVALSTADPHIDVVIRNISDQPLEFYADDCSAGYDTLRLELLGIDDKPLPQPIIVERSVMMWERNRIRTVTLEPGDVMVREVHFVKDASVGGIPYSNFPPMQAGDFHKIQMRAVFAVEPKQTPSNSKLWTGQVVSATNVYDVQQYSP